MWDYHSGGYRLFSKGRGGPTLYLFRPREGKLKTPNKANMTFLFFFLNQLRGGAFQPSYPLCINFPKYVQVSRCTVALNTPNALTSHTDTSRTSACYKLPLFSTICLYLVTLLRIFPFIFHS